MLLFFFNFVSRCLLLVTQLLTELGWQNCDDSLYCGTAQFVMNTRLTFLSFCNASKPNQMTLLYITYFHILRNGFLLDFLSILSCIVD